MVSAMLSSLVIFAAARMATATLVVMVFTMSTLPVGLTTILLSSSGMAGMRAALMAKALVLLMNYDFGIA